ncbi:uncharacterized protein L203_100903 [Cryptococcus depauperatus CBS 7841]|uniref:Uncharacterized protein n=1 Tax=Cryptococcus depauperatus CBS 7841 TaxID=1295531 RepID=A0A1E3I927_9TREE|nr:hypothetical protein L203_05101 [Cryptococcus depauperatus CBS 7841]
MSRPLVNSTHAVSATPTDPQSNPFAPSPPRPRDSGLNAIGTLLSKPYDDTDDESDYGQESVHTSASRYPVARSGPVIGQAQGSMAQKVKSFEGELDTSSDTMSARVDFPSPILQKDQGHGTFGYSSSNSLPPTTGLGLQSGVPRAPSRSNSNGALQPDYHAPLEGGRLLPARSFTEPLQINYNTYPPQETGHRVAQHNINMARPPPRPILLPAPTTPISALLAAPPQPHFSPMAPPSPTGSPALSVSHDMSSSPIPAHARASSAASESIRGYNIMAEKKAFFREGQEELFSPISPRPRRAKPSGLQHGSRAISGMDFWKRFSVSVHVDEAEKQKGASSDWLSKAQANRGMIKKMAYVLVFLIALIVAAIVIAVVMSRRSKDDSGSSKTNGNL